MSPRKSQSDDGLERINKVLAAAGLGSRRQVDELIEEGRVEIDGETIHQVGMKVDPKSVTIRVDGELLKRHKPVYFALHKPEGVLCTNRDPEGRPRVIDFVPNQARLFPVGRLDASSTGLILLTNDGELAQQLTHPKHGVQKRYAVVVVGQVELDALKRLQRGIFLAEGKAKVDQAKLKRVRRGCTEIEITLSEGKNREIRRVLARLGHKVVSLQRIAIGPLKLADLPEGAYRPLSNQEVAGLYKAVEEIRRERRAAKKARKKLLADPDQNSAVESEKSNPIVSGKGGPTKSKSPKKTQGREWESLPSLKLNPHASEEEALEESLEQESFGSPEEERILIRDHGPIDDEGDDDEFFLPARRAGTVIGQEDELVEDEEAFDFMDPMDDEALDEEDYEEPRSSTRRPKNYGGGKTSSGRSKSARASSKRSQAGGSPKKTSSRGTSLRGKSSSKPGGFKGSKFKSGKASKTGGSFGARRGEGRNKPGSSGGKPQSGKPRSGKPSSGKTGGGKPRSGRPGGGKQRRGKR